MWKQEEIPPFLDSNQDVGDKLLVYGKETIKHPKFLEVMFCYFHDKFIPKLLKLVNSPNLAKHKDIASLIEGGERSEAKNTPDTRKNQLIINDTDDSITKEDLF